jgi:23S rRNA (uracil-5-)-methyltransferase RumA
MTLTPKLFRRQVVDAARTGETIPARCLHAPPDGFCGGCTFQDRTYASQVAAKRAALRALWSADLPAEQLERIGMVASPQPFEYRTRMDYVASKQRFGLRRGGKFNYIVDLHECHLIPPSAFAVARSLYERATALGLPDYNLRTHEGFLRYVVVRRSPQNTLLLAVVTAAPDTEGVYAAAIEQVAQQTLDQHPEVVGFYWLVNDSLTDISFGTPMRHWSAGELAMQVGRRTLCIGPNTFFQNNVYLLLPLLDDVAGCVSQASRVADLYGGVGTIALHIADNVRQVTCVESVEESAAWARYNAVANSVENVSVVTSDVLAFLRDQPMGCFEVIVADPPRVGLGPDVCRELLRLRPEKLVYVSCNALTQLDDARILAAGYRLTELRGYDMFPQTPHMEALAVFERRPLTNDH